MRQSAATRPPRVPQRFYPPIVRSPEVGVTAFHAYDWYYRRMQRRLADVDRVFLTPCAAHKPIHQSPLHRNIYQRYAARYGNGRDLLVVSEPVVLIDYEDLSRARSAFLYDFPPKLLSPAARRLFVHRLGILLEGKDIIGCLPRHHARLIDDAVGPGWQNYWNADLYTMMARGGRLPKVTFP